MSINVIEKNKKENIDLLQIEQFSNLDISKKEIVVIEPNSTIAITMRKFLIKVGFENIQICKEAKEGMQIFAHFINKDVNVPIIIDNGSNKNVKKTIKETLEIQPNANVIISTAREKTDPEILQLFDIGISSVLYKPFVFENFKKSFSYMNKVEEQDVEEKDTREEEKDTKKDFEIVLLSHKQITDNEFRDIYKIDRSEADEIIRNALNNKTIALDKEITEAACNQCDSTNITYTAECPQCNGINFKQKDLVEHYDCGEIYPKESNYKTCPKCSKQIGSVGTDYREFAGYHVCSSCNGRFDRPLFKFSCLDCGNIFIDVLASWKKSRLYKIQK
jgi:DNA-binding NarL/FixJ family response regulator